MTYIAGGRGGQDHRGADPAGNGFLGHVFTVGTPGSTRNWRGGSPHGDDPGRGPGDHRPGDIVEAG